ncbi:alpha-mannosidase [Carnobacterium gallinarum]|uniref:alpha-mannosidase n=1 Tax=Carnobacterium gallinarum TaxID=2749 RepID=UPI00054DB3E9|nr:alpha-mannosidase [Carnobacterium gallinarum]
MKKVYILAHSHWDREWYMAYEQHHMRLVELMDDLLELFETDPDFNSFHLDGQTIILDDYLQVRPEKRDLVQKYITEGKLKIGPFYILQDSFLTSSESNTRNMLVGMEESKKWGAPVKLGYFPDTFGNMGQTPQMMRQAGLDVAAFGRGVKPTGFNNVVINDEKYASQYSEMWWEGPDGSEILGLLFANWYSNGNEIPVDKDEAKAFWEVKLKDAEAYASTGHLLMMNGCDHQPVQKDLSAAIRTANELYPDIEFVHTDFDTYITALKDALPEDLSTITGEITSQETEGWYTLANTASARIYLKQWNTKVSRQLENIAEPLATMAFDVTGEYPHDTLSYAWKTLMQNHPHDSICGCSIDEVHREMMTRFEKANEVGKYVADEAAAKLVAEIQTDRLAENDKKIIPFVVFNTSGSKKTGIMETRIELNRLPFGKDRKQPHELYNQVKNEKLPNFIVKNSQGTIVTAEISDAGAEFGYDLPKDKFRQPFMARYVTVKIPMEQMAPLSWETFALVESTETPVGQARTIVSENGKQMENAFIQLTVADNGLVTIVDKVTEESYTDLLNFENVGDLGNEYIFKQPNHDQAILSGNTKAKITVLHDSASYGEIEICHQLEIPVAMEELLLEEQKAVIEFRNRQSQRSKQMATFEIRTKVLLEKGSQQVKFATSFNNQMKDHRLRVLFPTNIATNVHYADSIYEVAERSNTVDAAWKNPTNPQHQHAFVNVHDGTHGVTVANFGLNEYEILADQTTIAVTLLRAVGELGDWGYFPTPEAQCLGESEVHYGISFHGTADVTRTYHEAMVAQVPFSSYQTEIHTGELPVQHQYAVVAGEDVALTAFKRKENETNIITRLYNLTNELAEFTLEIPEKTPELCNLLEEPMAGSIVNTATPHEIISYKWK